MQEQPELHQLKLEEHSQFEQLESSLHRYSNEFETSPPDVDQRNYQTSGAAAAAAATTTIDEIMITKMNEYNLNNTSNPTLASLDLIGNDNSFSSDLPDQQHQQHQHQHQQPHLAEITTNAQEHHHNNNNNNNNHHHQRVQDQIQIIQHQSQHQQEQPNNNNINQLPLKNAPKPRGRRKKIRTEPIRPICPQCEKQFSNQSALTKHKLTHSDERKFACQQCSKAFKRHDHLTGHMQTHSNRKPFNCTIQGCDKTYCDARSLRRHMENIHHIVTPRDPSNHHNSSSNNTPTIMTTNNNNNNNNNNQNHNITNNNNNNNIKQPNSSQDNPRRVQRSHSDEGVVTAYSPCNGSESAVQTNYSAGTTVLHQSNQHQHQQLHQQHHHPQQQQHHHPQQQQQQAQPPQSHLLQRRIQRLHSDQGTYNDSSMLTQPSPLSCVPPNSVGLQHTANDYHQHQSHHQHVSYSADYASTQHFSFDPNHMHSYPMDPQAGNTIAPPLSADSITHDSSLGYSSATYSPRTGSEPSIQAAYATGPTVPHQHQQHRHQLPLHHQSLQQQQQPQQTPHQSQHQQTQQSHLLQRRIQRLHSDQGTYGGDNTMLSQPAPLSCVPSIPVSLQHTANEYHQQHQHHHQQVSYSADYASTQHFSFDVNHMHSYHMDQSIGNTIAPPLSASSITDSGLGLNIHYEQQMTPTIGSNHVM